MVIVDEFHHAAADTYRRLLDHFRPAELIGLTATPERADGRSVLEWFDGRIASELRIWDAIERGLLAPSSTSRSPTTPTCGTPGGSAAGTTWTRSGRCTRDTTPEPT
ncbi:MAG: DEAD/DEAH box helicase family protein [Alphaproteobacteria bacterium]|nr:DEAD/DEAH box helicase family protein [Alphaproteobacteria bacterium]